MTGKFKTTFLFFLTGKKFPKTVCYCKFLCRIFRQFTSFRFILEPDFTHRSELEIQDIFWIICRFGHDWNCKRIVCKILAEFQICYSWFVYFFHQLLKLNDGGKIQNTKNAKIITLLRIEALTLTFINFKATSNFPVIIFGLIIMIQFHNILFDRELCSKVLKLTYVKNFPRDHNFAT